LHIENINFIYFTVVFVKTKESEDVCMSDKLLVYIGQKCCK